MTEFIPPGTRFLDLPPAFPMKRGGTLHGARIAYETWGTPNAARDNAIPQAGDLESRALRVKLPSSGPLVLTIDHARP